MSHRDQFGPSTPRPEPQQAPKRENDLKIISEVVLAEEPRGRDGQEVIRLSYTCAEATDGKPVSWYGLRIFYRTDDGTLRPGRQGITIRNRELAGIAAGFMKATTQPAAPPQRAPVARAPEHRRSSAGQPALLPAKGYSPRDDDGVF
jgi:hypothetical protein